MLRQAAAMVLCGDNHVLDCNTECDKMLTIAVTLEQRAHVKSVVDGEIIAVEFT